MMINGHNVKSLRHTWVDCVWQAPGNATTVASRSRRDEGLVTEGVAVGCTQIGCATGGTSEDRTIGGGSSVPVVKAQDVVGMVKIVVVIGLDVGCRDDVIVRCLTTSSTRFACCCKQTKRHAVTSANLFLHPSEKQRRVRVAGGFRRFACGTVFFVHHVHSCRGSLIIFSD